MEHCPILRTNLFMVLLITLGLRDGEQITIFQLAQKRKPFVSVHTKEE